MKPSNNKRGKASNQDYDYPFTKNPKYIINNDTSYISTQSLKYKRNKIDHDDYDDCSCDINIMNDFLNDDCLIKLFTYLPTCERPQIALVCKKWNNALYRTWSSVKRIKLSYWTFDDCQNLFQRNPTFGGGFRFLSSLLGKCGLYLTELDLAAFDSSKLMHVINESCPNIVKLRLRFRYTKNEELVNIFSRMSKLKILKIIFQNRFAIPDTVLSSLRDVADTLNELSLSSWNECRYNREISHFLVIPYLDALEPISQLNALQQIEFFGFKVNHLLDDYLKKSSIKYHNHHLAIQPEIKFKYDDPRVKYFLGDNIYSRSRYNIRDNYETLDMFDSEITDDFLYNIANNINGLKKLRVSCKWVTDVGMKAITKMKTLERLLLRCSDNDLITDSSIQLLTNLEYLHLPGSKNITDYSVTKIVENSTKLKFLSFLGTSVTSEFIKKASKISASREKILHVYFDSDDFTNMLKYESPYFRIFKLDPANSEQVDSMMLFGGLKQIKLNNRII